MIELADSLPLGFIRDMIDVSYTDKGMFEKTLYLIPLFPFIGFLLNGLFGHRLDKRAAGSLGTLAAFASFIWALLSVLALHAPTPEAGALEALNSERTREALHTVYGSWLNTEYFNASFGLYLDKLSSVMILVVTGIGTLIHLYSMGYMSHDAGLPRFFSYLNLFLFAMILLVLGDNLLMTFVGWEGVGLCSYLLIGFWYEDGKNAAAGMKAFVVNRIGDLGFLLGIFTLIALFGTVSYVATPERTGESRYRYLHAQLEVEKNEATKKKMTKEMEELRRSIERDRNDDVKIQPQTYTNDANFIQIPSRPGLLDYASAIDQMRSTRNNENAPTLFVGFKAPEKVSNLDLSNTLSAKSDYWKDSILGDILTIACILLFVGAMGKSAQIPLYVWLPDAMAGPTPVSALIHAATMVTSGIYMICRLHPLFALSPRALAFIGLIGGCTALFAALMGLTQLDIKKVLAYSTVSQLGYMFLGIGAGAFSLGMFHVLTHAFFKALLFLGAGSVIHAMSGEQDIRHMGGLRKKLPITFWTMMIGAMALAGVPFFAGWYSKDEILASTLIRYEDTHEKLYLLLYVMGCVAAFCTAFYTFRMMGLTFFGENRASEKVKSHIHESPLSMTFPLMVLAVFSLIGGKMYSNLFVSEAPMTKVGIENLGVLHLSSEQIHHAHHLNLIVTAVIAAAGILLAYFMYIKKTTMPNPENKNFLYRLSLNKFYVDEAYNVLFVMPFVIGSEIVHWIIEVLIIDLVVTGTGYAVGFFSNVLRKIQTGLVNSYAFAILAGTIAVLIYLMSTVRL